VSKLRLNGLTRQANLMDRDEHIIHIYLYLYIFIYKQNTKLANRRIQSLQAYIRIKLMWAIDEIYAPSNATGRYNFLEQPRCYLLGLCFRFVLLLSHLFVFSLWLSFSVLDSLV
jgi:hypothetical protein